MNTQPCNSCNYWSQNTNFGQIYYILHPKAGKSKVLSVSCLILPEWRGCRCTRRKIWSWSWRRGKVVFWWERQIQCNCLGLDEVGAFPNQQSCLTLFFLIIEREHAKHKRKLQQFSFWNICTKFRAFKGFHAQVFKRQNVYSSQLNR